MYINMYKKLKNIIFDFDGVILDSLDVKTKAFVSIYESYGSDIADKVRSYHINNGGVSRYEKFKFWHKNYLNIELNEDELSRLANKFSNLVIDKVLLSKEVKGSINFIKNYHKNFNFFIVSGTPHNEINKIADKLNISKYFNEILGSPKNKIECCNVLKEKYLLEPESTIFLGDAMSDFKAARYNEFHFALRLSDYNLEIFKDFEGIKFDNFKSLKSTLCFPKFKVLVTSTSFQDTPGNHHKLLKKQDWVIDFLRGPLDENEIFDVIDQYDAVICGDDKYSFKVIEKGFNSKLKVISKYGVGLDKIDLKAANSFNIPVTNCPGINQNSVAEHVFALLLSFEKNIHTQFNSVQKYSWKREIGNEVFNKTIGIVGFGAIGRRVAEISNAFGLRVLVFDPYIKIDDNFNKLNYLFVDDLDDVLLESDYITLHTPLNSETNNMINDTIINSLNKRPIIINTARSGLVDTKSIIHGINSKKISGYLCDVLDEEPISENELLVGVDKVLITPHVGSRTYENVEKQAEKAIINLVELLDFKI